MFDPAESEDMVKYVLKDYPHTQKENFINLFELTSQPLDIDIINKEPWEIFKKHIKYII